MQEEVWKDVVGYEGYYKVSNLGNVKRIIKNGVAAERLLSPSTYSGYPRVCLCVDGRQNNYLVHRLVAIAFLGKPESNKEVNHINGIKGDSRLENLEWVTSRENHIHAVKMGLSTFASISGENSHKSKLTESDVSEIIKLRLVDKLKFREIGEKYNVVMSTIQKIFHKKNWKHIPIQINQ